MEPIQIHVSVELNLSQDVKNFLTSIVSNHAPVAKPAPAPAPQAPVAKPAPAPAPQAPAAPAAPAPVPQSPAPTTSAAPSVTIEQVRQALAAKVNGHREEIKAKLNSLGAPSVTKLDPAKYVEMFSFLNALS
jgi:hypothetical protein